MRGLDSQRIRDPLMVLLVIAGLFFGLAPLLLPKQFADLTGFAGTDTFIYRLAGAATLGYGVSLLIGFRAAWRELRIIIAATLVFNLGSLVACALAIAGGSTPWSVYPIVAASVIFVAGTAILLMNPPLKAGESAQPTGPQDLAAWIVVLFVIGTIASLVFGLGPLVGAGGFGVALGYTGHDDFIYRQAGAATFGASIGGMLALQTRRWREIRLAAIAALAFNGASVYAALLEIAGGNPQPVAWLILGAAVVVSVGMVAALARNGR